MKKLLIIFFVVAMCLFSLNITNVYADESNNTSNVSASNTDTSNKKPNADYMVNVKSYSCGSDLVRNIPSIIPKITSMLYNAVMVLVPVILVLMGILDLVKGIMSQKDDEIKKGRESLIRRLITGLIILIIVMIVKLFVGILSGGDNSSRIIDCVDCFISNTCTEQTS